MSQFYTKEQMDQLATIIGQRIKASVSTNSVTTAILESDEYVLLTKAEKASLATGNIQPALNNDSFLAALEKGFNPIPDIGLAKDYPGTGWYKATDTGTVFNKDVPDGETHIFEGDPKEYISVYTKEDARLYADRAATSNITDMAQMFFNVTTFNTDISHWDTSSVTSMRMMFLSATAFNQPLNFDTSNVTDMGSMFAHAKSFNQPLNFNTSSATSMSSMFYGATSFNQPLNFNTSSVTGMSNMFINATSFNQSLNFDTSNVTTMGSMFANATSFNQDISSWDTSNVTNMRMMFKGAALFNKDLSQWCVTLITTKPEEFDDGATAWTLPKPVWGTCSRGEDATA